MRIVVSMTVNDRPWYLEQVLRSWLNVRGVQDVEFIFNLEPCTRRALNISLINNFVEKTGGFITVNLNEQKNGVQHNPYVALSRGFVNNDYVILAEDDLLVAEDILEMHKWIAKTYQHDNKVKIGCSFNESVTGTKEALSKVTGFASVLVWGTWKKHWVEIFEPTWDHNYSTGTGNQRGWDWNINLRIMQPTGWQSIQPLVSRVQNIGEVGTHSVKGDYYVQATDFNTKILPLDYYEQLS